MGDVLGQVLPTVSALVGVGLTLVGTAFADRRHFRRDDKRAREERILHVFADLVQTVTELARTLRTIAEQLEDGSVRGFIKPVSVVDDLVGQTRKNAAMARLVGSAEAVALVIEVERALVPLHALTVSAAKAKKGESLHRAGQQLFTLRDALVEDVRRTVSVS